MKKIIMFVTGLFILLGMTGCGGGGEPQPTYQEKEMPSWYINPPANNPMYLYGLGEGMNIEQATRNALDNMASRLSVTVESSYEVKTKIQKGYNESFSQNSERNLKSEVAKIRISNYEVDKSEKIAPGHYVVLVKSDKEKFYSSLVKELDQKFQTLNDKRAANQNANIIKRAYFYQDAVNETNGMMPTLLVLGTLSEQFDDAKYLKDIQALNAENEALKKAINFVIQSDRASVNMAEAVRVALTDSGFKVVSSKAQNANTVFVKLTSRAEESQAMGFIVAKITTNIEVNTADGKTVGGNKLNINGQSPQSFELAKENGSKKLKKMIEKDGINTILGLKL